MPSFQPPSRSPASRLSSPSMYQLKAQLQVLRRPMVWGSAAVLLAAGYFLFSYWSNPNSSTQSRSQAAPRQNPLYQPQIGNPGGSGEFGNLPGLNSPTGQPGTLRQPGTPGLNPAPSAAHPPLSPSDPFATASPQDSAGMSIPGLSTLSNPASSSSSSNNAGVGSTDFIQGGYGAPASGSSTGSSTGSSPASPLQSALDRATHSASTPSASTPSDLMPSNSSTSGTQPNPDLPSLSSLGSTSPSTSSSGSSTNRTSSTPTALGDTPLSPTGQSAAQPYAPRTSLPATTGYSVPPAFRTPTTVAPAASSSGFSNFSRPQPLPGDYSAPLSPPYATQPMLPSGSSSGYGSRSSTGAQSSSVP